MERIRKHQKKSNQRDGRGRMAGLTAGVAGILMICFLGACLLPEDDSTSGQPEAVSSVVQPVAPKKSYDSTDTTIVMKKDEEAKTITFLNLNRGRQYTLSYDGTTVFSDKYGESISNRQVSKGDIVDITFLKDSKHLDTLMLSPKAWEYSQVERYEMDFVRQELIIGEEVYKLTDNTRFLSDGQFVEAMDINTSDVLTFHGIDKQVLSARVEKGHGYLRLVNDENFVGGWIEIGQAKIQRITEDMLLVLPEGRYQVNISYKGSGGTRDVCINRNEETALDIGDMEVAKPKTGMILFSLSPSKASLYIDGTLTDASEPVTLEYGIHQLIVKAEGYKSVTQYIRVGQASAGVNVVLEKAGSSDEEEDSKDDVTDVSTNYYKVHIDGPEDVEVYVDGNYVGMAPCSFKKVSGAHVVSLRKTGYQTRSYTIQVDDEEKDVRFSFAEMIANDGEEGESKEGDN